MVMVTSVVMKVVMVVVMLLVMVVIMVMVERKDVSQLRLRAEIGGAGRANEPHADLTASKQACGQQAGGQ